MLDTVSFKIDTVQNPDAINWKRRIPKNQAEQFRQVDNNSFYGKIRNLKIHETINGINVEGSIAKFLSGENVTTLSLQGCKDALHEIETVTGFDLNKAIVKRVDFGKSIITEKCTGYYLPLFQSHSRYKRTMINRKENIETVSFSTKTGVFGFCIYDKIMEMQDREWEIPSFFENCNVLRMEYRILKTQGIKTKLGNGENINVWQLVEKTTYNMLNNLFIGFYDAIEKGGRNVFFDAEKEYTPKEYFEILAESMRQTNPAYYNALLSQLFQQEKLSAKNKNRIREQEKRNSRNYTFSTTNDLILELDEKMHCRAV